ncbi:MAG: PaaI family thioesterase [candidate division Zixibacteria bacterium]|nr:PaaI family thioesterase [candidate division Zixibacteria bacterium]
MREIAKYRNCFVCGDQNPHGLQAKFFFDGEQAVAELKALDTFEGYRGIYHGGILSAMLDEVMIKAILAQDVFAVTAEMTVRYHRPVETGAELRFVGRITGSKGRMYTTEGEVVNHEGVLYASATGKYIEAKEPLKGLLNQSLD